MHYFQLNFWKNFISTQHFRFLLQVLKAFNVVHIKNSWLFFFPINFQLKINNYPNETYDMIFNLYKDKQYFIFGLPINVSFSQLFLELENCIYTMEHFYFLNVYSIQYFKILIMFVLIFLISNLLFIIASFLSYTSIKDSEKLSQYECGFEPFDNATRHPFDVHFYVVGILFLIFDVEIALLFPWIYSLNLLNWFGFYIMVLFLVILTIGFFYEWHRGALAWPHKKKT